MTKQYRIVGYAGDQHLPTMREEDILKLTHLNVAFGHVVDHVVTIKHMKNTNYLENLKQVNPNLTILLSVGGWSAGGFSEAVSTDETRQQMVSSIVDILKEHDFDGIDLDWEYPTIGVGGIGSAPSDKENFTKLLAEIRDALDDLEEETGKYYLQTIATGCDQYYLDGTEMDKIEPYLDYVQLMTYDMRGGFQTLTGHHTNLFASTGDIFRISVAKSVQLFHDAGIPKEKLVIGAAFYSRMWKDVPDVNNGYLQMTAGSGGYGPDFTELDAEYINVNGYQRFWDDEAKAPFLFDGSSFITYEDEESIQHKCRYLIEEELGGIMFWEYKCDETYRLLDTMHRALS